jgi:uncharacterized membrane protein
MESKAQFLGHPLHPMLIVFPLGLLASAAIFDAIYLLTGTITMAIVAYWMVVAGIVGGLVAAPFSLIDWLAIPTGTRAKSIGMIYGVGNVIVLLLFTGSWLLRLDMPEMPGTLACILSFAGAGLALVTGWLGGELVDRLGVGVDEGANLNASNSLFKDSAMVIVSATIPHAAIGCR